MAAVLCANLRAGKQRAVGQPGLHGYHNWVGIEGHDGAGLAAPIFVVASGDGAELSAGLITMGWQPIFERRKGHVESGFLASGARVAIVDARDGLDAGLEAVRELADVVELNAGALMILIAQADPDALSRAIEAGVTHALEMPFDQDRLFQHVRLAQRHNLRLTGRGSRIAVDPTASLTGGRDALTGLGDALAARRWVEARLSEGRPCSLLLFAITRFDMINTAFGRETGDDVLTTVARLIGPLLADLGGRNTLIARTAGAEFVIGIDGELPVARLRLLAEQLIDQIDRPVISGDHNISLSSRSAIAVSRPDDRDAAVLFQRASGALALAKASDQGRVRIVGDADAGDVIDEALKADLRAALDRKEIRVVFQPQVSIASRRIVGVEALARWQHPTLGALGAPTLFAAAEGSDYLLALSAHIQRSALELASQWPKSLAAMRLSVNITASDIAQPGFADSFLALVDETGFPRNRLTIEVTESGLIEDLGTAASLLAQLRASGCRVAIDDFGTGYSSLAYLKMLPLDYLKIDRQLAQDIAGSPRDRVVVRGVIDMARSLGLAVVAEGVETQVQLALLAREGCNYYQGFLCSEAVDSEGLVATIAAWDP